MLFDSDGPQTKEELAAYLQVGRKFQRVWAKRTLIATVAFVLSCTGVVLFSDVGPFFAYALSYGRFFVVLSMILLFPFTICIGMALNGWFYVRRLRKDYNYLTDSGAGAE